MIVILTCSTIDCQNYGIGIPFEDPADYCVCGPCGKEILDKVEQL